MLLTTSQACERLRLRVTGVVQGVGFRPFVYRLALEHGLTGFVGNDSEGVLIEVEGNPAALDAFQSALVQQPPPLAHIDKMGVERLAPCNSASFAIVDSRHQDGVATLVSPDLAICDDCLRELFDPADRRYRYPFINCTNCGPRFTITRALPYDRPQTTMAAFPMCPDCEAEYHNPLDRRFHAQPIACPNCGPQVMYIRGGEQVIGDDAIAATRDALLSGAIVAVKGLGGFHLACDATDPQAVERLRQRKGRPAKPFAVMVADVPAALELAHLSADEAALLTSRQRPIVLARKRSGSRLAEGIAPGNSQLGLMLPYTPLHYVLLHGLGRPLVMTSGNLSGEPIVTANADALDRLGTIADVFLLHDRDIHVPCDDSVVRVLGGAELPVRRSRGYAPFPVRLPFSTDPLLAVGGDLKNTFCLARDDHAFLSQYMGDMDSPKTLETFARSVEHMSALFCVEPQAVVCDLHPGYRSARAAREFVESHHLPLVRVQHHHAHIASVMVEHGLTDHERVIGICLDGTGYGTDGAVWGGEVLLAGYRTFERAAHLTSVPLPGGDAAIHNPCRMALAYLWASGMPWDDDLLPSRAAGDLRILRQQLERQINTVPTSSMGRLFDAVASLLGVCQHATYEGQAAIELESLAAPVDTSPYAFVIQDVNGRLLLDPGPVLRGLVADWRRGADPGTLAGYFHASVTAALAEAVLGIHQRTGLKTVALSGGVFQNALLLESLVSALSTGGFTVLTHRLVPPNDGGLALGQAAIAHYQLFTR